MTFYLIKLARFVSKKEQQEIINDIRIICQNYSDSFEVMSDTWRPKNRILVQIHDKLDNPINLYNELLENPGVITIIEFFPETFNFDLSEFKSLIELLIKTVKLRSKDKIYNIDLRSFCKIPFHKRSIIDRLKKKKVHNQEEASLQLYLEINRNKKNGNLIGRLGNKILKYRQKDFTGNVHPALVLYSPYTTQEVADFFRLGLSFNIKIIFSDENGKAHFLIKKVKQSLFKGTDKVIFDIIPNVNQLISNNLANCYGFSLWGKKNMDDLSLIISSKRKEITGNGNSIHFLFGNEEVGLPLKVRAKIPIFRIGTSASEPLRASQAASYVIGFLSAEQSRLKRKN